MGNDPNPFNGSTTIGLCLPGRGEINLLVYNVAGRKVATLATGVWQSGQHAIVWDGLDDQGAGVATGVYFLHLRAGRVHPCPESCVHQVSVKRPGLPPEQPWPGRTAANTAPPASGHAALRPTWLRQVRGCHNVKRHCRVRRPVRVSRSWYSVRPASPSEVGARRGLSLFRSATAGRRARLPPSQGGSGREDNGSVGPCGGPCRHGRGAPARRGDVLRGPVS